jgi:hypothetical protein
MAISISNAFPVSPVQNSPKVQTQAAVVAQASTDAVKLSQSGQIHALRQLGQGAAQIANFLDVTLASVNSVLGIVVAKAAVAVADAKAAEPGAPASSTAAAPSAAPVGVQAGPTPVAELNVAKG